MRGAVVIFAITFLSQCSAKDLVDYMLDRVHRVWRLPHNLNLEDTMHLEPCRLGFLQSGPGRHNVLNLPDFSRFTGKAAAGVGRDCHRLKHHPWLLGAQEGRKAGIAQRMGRMDNARSLGRQAVEAATGGEPRSLGSSRVVAVRKQEEFRPAVKNRTRRNPIRAAAALRRQLSLESNARSYYRFPQPGTIVHVAYLRAPSDPNVTVEGWREAILEELKTDRRGVRQTEVEGSKTVSGKSPSLRNRRGAENRAAREKDYNHFKKLIATLESDVISPPVGTMSDSRTSVRICIASDEDSETCRVVGAEKDRVEVRYQQFTEFSTYTFVLDGKAGNAEFAERGGAAVTSLLDRGERLVDSLKRVGSWWYNLPGEPFFVAVLVMSPVTSQEGCADTWDSINCTWSDQRFLSGAELFTGTDPPVGALIGSQNRAALVSSYNLKRETQHLHVAALYSDLMEPSEFEEVSRRIADFLELEQYRLLTLMSASIARNIFPDLNRINEAILDVLNVLRGGKPTDKQTSSQLSRLITLQTRVEALDVEVRERFAASEAYGMVVQRRLESLMSQPGLGMVDFERFVTKRAESALRTYQLAGARLGETTRAVTRATALLRTIVEQEIQQTNDQLLFVGTFLSFGSLFVGGLSILIALNIIRPLPY